MADEDRKNWMSCLGWGCLVVAVVSVLGIGGCLAYVYKGGSAAHSVANAYLESVDAGRYEEAFGTLGPVYTEDRGLAEFVAFEQAARAQMGACGDWRMSGTSINRESGRSVALLTYRGSRSAATAGVWCRRVPGSAPIADRRSAAVTRRPKNRMRPKDRRSDNKIRRRLRR